MAPAEQKCQLWTVIAIFTQELTSLITVGAKTSDTKCIQLQRGQSVR